MWIWSVPPRGGQRARQPDLHARIGDHVVGPHGVPAALDLDRLEHIPIGGRRRRGRGSLGGLSGLAGRCGRYWPRTDVARARITAIEILVELDPQALQRLRAVVGIGDHLIARETLLLRIQVRVEHVVGAVLPIVGPGTAIAGAIRIDRHRAASAARRSAADRRRRPERHPPAARRGHAPAATPPRAPAPTGSLQSFDPCCLLPHPTVPA